MADQEFTYRVYRRLQDYCSIANGELPELGLAFDLSDFCSTYKLSLMQTYAALQHLEQEGILLLDHNGKKVHRIRINAVPSRSGTSVSQETVSGRIIQALLRNYGGIAEQLTPVQEGRIAKKLGIEKSLLVKHLDQMSRDQVIRYEKPAGSGEIRFLVPREDTFVRHSIARGIVVRNRVKQEKAQSMLEFVKNRTVCRNRQLQHYFGEADKGPCGNCDVCLSRSASLESENYSQLAHRIDCLLDNSGPMNVREISLALETSAERVAKTLELLVEKGSLAINLQNKFQKRQ